LGVPQRTAPPRDAHRAPETAACLAHVEERPAAQTRAVEPQAIRRAHDLEAASVAQRPAKRRPADGDTQV
jgi:hypothetical protein